jgi:ubiquitin carboxyl-terminal hydrolase 4/11/15
MDLWRVPDLLMIELKRFENNLYATTKIEAEVTYPDELDLHERVLGPQNGEPLKYRLYAVSEHFGSLVGGHYRAHAIVRGGDDEHWYSFDDSTCAMVNAAEAHNKAAYVLFYERIAEGTPRRQLLEPPVKTQEGTPLETVQKESANSGEKSPVEPGQDEPEQMP